MRLVYKRRALRHLEAIHDYIAQHDPEAAKRVLARIGHATNRLAVAPLSARPDGPLGTRILVVPGLPYVVLHRVNTMTSRLSPFFIRPGAGDLVRFEELECGFYWCC